ncbi:MAG: hypothetical protein QOE13_2062 [Gaiellaceae bacterium]|nr:hypothetical protein [Gaiellaceae bacterium]
MKIKKTYLVCIAALAALLAAPTAGAGRLQLESPTLSPGTGGLADVTRLLASPPRHLSSASWWGGTYTVPDGEHVSLYISTSYPQADALAQQWVAFFAGLPHGKELSLAKVYIAPLGEVSEMCYSDDVLGCYGGQTVVTVGDSSAGVAPASIAAHEYGHHIAANRNNAPWPAIDWGTKRWASAVGICARVAGGTAFPGDEGSNYSLNPGEGFAESYRILVETNGTATGYDWPILDPSFRPTPASLAAIREDVIHPWVAPTKKTVRGKFLRGSRIWTTQVTTPLDGDLRIRVTVPGGGADDVTLLSSDGRTVLATGSWASTGGKSVEYKVCGARSVRVRVTRGGAAARFTLQVQAP